jgi:hypothetical protein
VRAQGTGRLLAAGALAAALAACSRGPESFRIGSVRAGAGIDPSALGEAGLDAQALEAAARVALSASGFRTAEGADAQVASVGIISMRVVADGKGPSAEVRLEIVLGPPEGVVGPSRREPGVGSAALLAVATPADGWRRALAEAAQGAADALAISARAEGKTEDGLLSDLASKDERVREHAARVLGERRSRAAVPALIGRVRGEDPRVALRIVGALAQIGDERAVPALIDLSRGADPVVTARLVRFIGDIGGPEAEGYLLTLASGHADPWIRKAAREALDDLAARPVRSVSRTKMPPP